MAELADPTANGRRYVWARRSQPCLIWGPGDHSQTECVHAVALALECEECWTMWLAESGRVDE